MSGYISDIHPVNEYSPTGYLIHPSYKADDGGLSCPCGAHESACFSRFNAKADIPQDPIVLVVCKPYILELNFSLWPSEGYRLCGIRLNLVSVKKHEDSFCRSHSSLHNIVFLSKVINGTEELLQVIGEGKEHTEFQRAPHYTPSAKPNQKCKSKRRDKIHGRPENRVYSEFLHTGTEVVVIDPVKLLEFLFFPAENLNYAHSRDILSHSGIDPGEPYPDCPIRVPGLLAKYRRNREYYRQHSETDQCKPNIHLQHHYDDSGKKENIFEQVHQNRSVHLIQCVHVIGYSGDKPAYRVLVEERQ